MVPRVSGLGSVMQDHPTQLVAFKENSFRDSSAKVLGSYTSSLMIQMPAWPLRAATSCLRASVASTLECFVSFSRS